jgi:protein-tyrosine phosphatase
MAEAVFVHLVNEAGLQHIGSTAHPGTLDILTRNAIAYNGRGRQIHSADLDDFDYIITMDNDNLRNVKSLGGGRAYVAPLLSYAPHLDTREVPDPFYTGGFEGVYKLVRESCACLLAEIRREHGF